MGNSIYKKTESSSTTQEKPSQEQIERQVERIINSDAFSAAPKLCSFLLYIVDQTLKGNQKRLKQYSIATEALGWDEDFDPDTSPAVRLDAGRLRSALAAYYAKNPGEKVHVSVPKGRYIPSFQLILKPEGDLTNKSTDHEKIGTEKITYLEPNRLLIVSLFTQMLERDLSSLAESLTEQLVVEFAGYPDISIATAGLTDDNSAKLQAEGANQRARFVLCGRVRMSGEFHRITLQLHDIKSKTIIWANKFEISDNQESIFEAQDEIAAQVAGMIADDFGIIAYRQELEREFSTTKSSDAHNALLFHRHLTRTLTEDAYNLAREKIDRSLKLRPSNSSLWAATAQTIFYGNVLGYSREKNWIDLVRYSAQRSLELDRNNHYAQVAMAQYSLFRRDFGSVFDLAQRLLDKNPRSASNQLSAGYFRSLSGDWENGVEMISEALERLHSPPNWAYKVLFLNSYRLGDYDAARRYINLYYVPEHYTPPLLRAAVMMRLNRRQDAESAAEEVRRINPDLSNHLENYLRYLSTFDEITENIKQPLQELGLIDF